MSFGKKFGICGKGGKIMNEVLIAEEATIPFCRIDYIEINRPTIFGAIGGGNGYRIIANLKQDKFYKDSTEEMNCIILAECEDYETAKQLANEYGKQFASWSNVPKTTKNYCVYRKE